MVVEPFAIVLATFASLIVGIIWYVTLNRFWLDAARLGAEMSQPSLAVFATSLACEAIMAIVFSLILGPGEISFSQSIGTGLLLWSGFVATTLVVNTRFQGFGWNLPLIDGGHWLLVIMAQASVFAFCQ